MNNVTIGEINEKEIDCALRQALRKKPDQTETPEAEQAPHE